MSQVVILCAGRGNRLASVTAGSPKALVPVLGRPLISRVVEKLGAGGFSDFVVVTGMDGHLIREALRHAQGVRFARQPVPRGTADAVRCAASLLARRFLLTYGDLWVADEEYRRLNAHMGDDECWIGVSRVDRPTGAAVYLDGSRVRRVVEKPVWSGMPDTCWNGSGLYVLNSDIVSDCGHVQPSQRGELELADALQLAIARGVPLHAFPLRDVPVDLGLPERYYALCSALNRKMPIPSERSVTPNGGPSIPQGS